MSASENVELAELQISNAITAMESEEAPSIVHAMLAQTRATLALAEQQRLANIIALAHVADTSDAEVTPMEREAWEALGVRGEGTMRPEIREALGLS